jgi:hypothetical protein
MTLDEQVLRLSQAYGALQCTVAEYKPFLSVGTRVLALCWPPVLAQLCVCGHVYILCVVRCRGVGFVFASGVLSARLSLWPCLVSGGRAAVCIFCSLS